MPRKKQSASDKPHPLTRRELDVLKWIMEGKRNSEIAKILGISSRTVEQHVAKILVKLNVETRTAAAMVGLRNHES